MSTRSWRKPFAVWMALAVLCLCPGGAVAQSISFPSGGSVLPSGAPFTVLWNIPGPGRMHITLEYVGSTALTLATNLPNSGQAQVSLPATVECPKYAYLRIVRYDQSPSQPLISVSTSGIQFTCPIAVTKHVVNTTGRRVSGAFRMRVQCEPGSQTFVDIAAPNQGSFTRKVHVPPNSTVCTIQETGMALPPAGCSWQTTYPGGQQRPPGGSVTVVNTLQCGPVSPPPPR